MEFFSIFDGRCFLLHLNFNVSNNLKVKWPSEGIRYLPKTMKCVL